MKYVAILILFIFSIPLLAQPCGINFTYDNAGNRIKRSQCWGTVSLVHNDSDLLKDVVQRLHDDTVTSEIRAASDGEQHGVITDISGLVVFPNPSIGRFQITSQAADPQDQVYITNDQGQLVLRSRFGDGRFDLSAQSAGTYFIVVRHTSGEISSSKIIRINY